MEASLSLRCIFFLLYLLDGGSLPGDSGVFLVILTGVDTWLEESLDLDECSLLEKLQLRAVLLGSYLDVLKGRDLLLVTVLILLGDADGNRELGPYAAILVVLNLSVHRYETDHCEIVVSCHNL